MKSPGNVRIYKEITWTQNRLVTGTGAPAARRKKKNKCSYKWDIKGIPTERQRDRETERQRERETERQRDIETERQRDRETERRTDRETERKTS